ncbi:dihydroxyacetone kinase subunit DhaL [Parafrigoribacterium mesophilum]|uniref:dihydroxyacetone kinase subunit DhaL n=1 Tax=Parafrigoribacterium mesophilum TaxID=433646 RepID=UPI0031FC4838
MTEFSRLVTEQRDYLTELDSAIGDADHGTNMTRGMTAAMAKAGAAPAADAGEFFKTIGMTLVSSVGGASGPLYGTFFLRLGTAAGDAETLDGNALAAALRAGLEGVVARGKAELEDKTMLDALIPAVGAFQNAVESGSDLAAAADAALAAAEQGRDATEPMLAKKGRASYLGERSIGHIDPGATSTALLFRALATALH